MHLALVAPCGILFPDQGSSLGLQHWEHSLSHWTTREVPLGLFVCLFYINCIFMAALGLH